MPDRKPAAPRVGFLTFDLQEFTADCLNRVYDLAGDSCRIKAYPIQSRAADFIRFPYRRSNFNGKSKSFTKGDAVPEGLMISVHWRAALACARESDIVVLFGIQAGTALLLTILARLFGRKLVSVNQTLPPHRERQRRWWVRWLKGWILRRCDVHVVQTPVTRDTLRDVYGLPEDRFVVAPFEAGWRIFESLRAKTSESNADFRKQWGWPDDDCVFLFVGTLLEFKGTRLLLESMRILKSRGRRARLVFCGPESPRATEWSLAQYREETRRLGLEDEVKFTGRIPYDDLPGYYRGSDALVLPTSRDMWPKVLVEAAAFELPLISTTAAGTAGSLVVDGQTGALIPPDDPESLADAMERMLDPRHRENWGRNARAFCVSFCDAEKEARGYYEAIELARAA